MKTWAIVGAILIVATVHGWAQKEYDLPAWATIDETNVVALSSGTVTKKARLNQIVDALIPTTTYTLDFLTATNAAEARAKLDVAAGGTSVDTIPDLVALTNTTPVIVQGRSAAGDGGGGIFYYDVASVATTNPGTIFGHVSGSGRWLRNYSGPVNVKWFGAVGDGTTIDTTSVSNAMRLGGTYELNFPSGRYNLTNWTSTPVGGLLLSGTKGQTVLVGDSAASFVSITNSFIANGLSFSNWTHPFLVTSAVDRVVIQNCKFDHCISGFYANTNQPATATNTTRLNDFVFSDNWYTSGGSGGMAVVYLRAAFDSAKVTDNLMEEMNGPGIKLGDNVESLHDTWVSMIVRGNTIRHNTNSLEAYGVLLFGKGSIVQGNTIQRMTYHTNQEASAIYVKCRQSIITENFIEEAGGVQGAIVVKGVSRDEVGGGVAGYSVIVSKNHIVSTNGAYTAGIYVDNDDVLIEGNIVEGFRGNTRRDAGLHLGDCKRVMIRNNHFINMDSYRVLDIQAMSDITIEGNTIDGVFGVAGTANQVMVFASGARMTNIFVRNNTISRHTNLYSTSVGLFFQSAVTNLEVTGNTFPVDIPVALYSTDGSPSDQIRVTDNFFPGTTNTYLQPVYFPAAQTPVHAIVDRNLNAAPYTTYGIFVDGDKNPSVAYQDGWFECINTTSTTITNFANGYNGQEIKVYFTTGNTIIQHLSTAIKTKSGANTTVTSGSWMSFVRRGGVWWEFGKSSQDNNTIALAADAIGTPLIVGTSNSVGVFKVDSKGQVLIGPGTPQVPFEILTSNTLWSTHGVHLGIFDVPPVNAISNSGGSMVFGGTFDGTASPTHWAGIRGIKENSTTNEYGGHLVFYTRPNAGTETERMRISSAGAITVPGSVTATNGFAWPSQSRANILVATEAFTNSLALVSTNRIITNYFATTSSRNVGISLTAGTLTVTNAGCYVVNFGMSYTTAIGTITGTIFTNGVATNLRFVADSAVNTHEVLRVQGLFDLPAGCVLDVRLKDTSSENITMESGSFNVIQQFD